MNYLFVDPSVFFLTLFWALAYIFAIIHAIVYRRHAIPIFAISLNFAWEIVSSFMYREYIQIVWCLLDILIVLLLLRELKLFSVKRNLFYLSSFIIYGAICFLFFNYRFLDGMSGFVFLSFAMDLAMAVCYLHEINKYKWTNGLYCWVAIWKMLGDATAWWKYKSYFAVMLIGIIVLVMNILFIYLAFRCWVINEKGKKRGRGQAHRHSHKR